MVCLRYIFHVNPLLGGGNSNIFYFHPEPWGNDPIWLRNIFQLGWNHHLVNIRKGFPGFIPFLASQGRTWSHLTSASVKETVGGGPSSIPRLWKGTHFKRKWISWTNHQFLGDMLVFKGHVYRIYHLSKLVDCLVEENPSNMEFVFTHLEILSITWI